MQTHKNGSRSLANSLSTPHRQQLQNHITPHLPLPVSTLGEPINGFNSAEMESLVTIANFGEYYSGGIHEPSDAFYPQPLGFQETSPFFANSSGHENAVPWDLGRLVSRSELSLSLATSGPSPILQVHDGCSDLGSSGYVVSEHGSCSSSKNASLSHDSRDHALGSRFLHAVQEILAEIASYTLEHADDTSYSVLDSTGSCDPGLQNNHLYEPETMARKKHLLSLLQLVDDRYSQCVDEIHTVTSAFHAVTELDPNLHARFVLPGISFMYRNLRERITSHILLLGQVNVGMTGEDRSSFETSFIQKQWALQQLSKQDQQLWRPQRGLPEKSVSVLRAWMFQNFLHPYPKDGEKQLLALKSGLTRNQVSNWFINARVRLWKPMIEEMYAEMKRRKASRNGEDSAGNLMRFNSRGLS